jgi:hypothetical protein
MDVLHDEPSDWSENRYNWVSDEEHDIPFSSEKSRSDAPSRRNSTITATERQAFGRIFDDIIAAPTDPSPEVEHSPEPTEAVSGSDSTQHTVSSHASLTGNAYLDALFSDAAEKSKKKKKIISFGPDATQSAGSGRHTRPAMNDLGGYLGIEEPGAESEPRLAELKRVEGLLRSADTDLNLWAVLEKEVFPLVQTLADSYPTFDAAQLGPADRGETAKLARLATACANYPHLLLVAFRLLAHEFDSPATCRALFVHIKTLGPVSQVLGASVALYHGMIDLTWRAYRDPSAASDLLHEMDHGGLEFDDETGRILSRILSEACAGEQYPSHGRQMPAGSIIWAMDTFRAGVAQLADWKRRVSSRLDDRITANI